MICASISENDFRFAQVSDDVKPLSIKFIANKLLPLQFTPSRLYTSDSIKTFKSIFATIKEEIQEPERELLLSIPSNWVDFFVSKVDKDIREISVEKILNWNVETRIGNLIKHKFIQHYPLSENEGASVRNYLTVSYFKELGDILTDAAKDAGFTIKLLDINIFNAASAIEKLQSTAPYKRWGIWLVGSDYHNLLVIDSGEFYQFFDLNINNQSDLFVDRCIFLNSDSNEIINELNSILKGSKEELKSLEQLYFYAYENSEIFDLLLGSNVKNLKTVDPFEFYKPGESSIESPSAPKVNCQFLDVIGSALRETDLS